MIYKRHVPCPPLNDYIEELFYVEGPLPYLQSKILTMPSLHLIVNLGGAFRIRKSNQDESFVVCTDGWWGGLWSSYHIIDFPLDIQFFGVQFKPSGAYPFLRRPLSEIYDQVVPADALWGPYIAEMRERLYAAPNVQTAFALLEQLLLARLCEAPHGLELVQYAIKEIARHHGTLSIRALSEQIGISQNYLGMQFKRMVGLPPKQLVRFYRIAYVLSLIHRTQLINWTTIAHQSGFYDQSHFNKDFLAFTGHNPTDYLRQRCPLHVETRAQ